MSEGKLCVCSECKQEFTSKTKLFKHLESHGFEGLNTKLQKVVVLIGWLAPYVQDNDVWTKEGPLKLLEANDFIATVETSLFRAVYALENKCGLESCPTTVDLPKGYSRASSSRQRASYLLGIEPSCHSQCDTFCFQCKAWYAADGEASWIAAINAMLPSTIRIIDKTVIPNAGRDFHAESIASQRRFECMLPLRIVMPIDAAVAPSEPIVRKARHAHQVKNDFDPVFPIETFEGQARIEYFRKLKKFLKKLCSDPQGTICLHNFATGGATPDEAASTRKVDRIFHKDLVVLGGEPWVVFSVSGDAFLLGQTRKFIGVTMAVMRGWLPEEFVDVALRTDMVVNVPAVPGWSVYIAENKYAFWEAKFEPLRLDPRRRTPIDSSAVDAWTGKLHDHIHAISRAVGDSWVAELQQQCVCIAQRSHLIASLKDRAMIDLENSFAHQFGRLELTALLKNEAVVEAVVVEDITSVGDTKNSVTPNCTELDCVADQAAMDIASDKQAEDVSSTAVVLSERAIYIIQELESIDDCSAAYKTVLRLLREADHSGMWPLSSVGRQRVMVEGLMMEKGGTGGSFSVGCLSRNLAPPRGNKTFPELMKACFVLERVLCPDRPPSGAIAINKHCCFKPHRDCGAGNGQSQSLIVALGNFTGGELVSEDTVHDIRYKPICFDGWSERHWTMPFVGERYSLVWFTPLGVDCEQMWWLPEVDERLNELAKKE